MQVGSRVGYVKNRNRTVAIRAPTETNVKAGCVRERTTDQSYQLSAGGLWGRAPVSTTTHAHSEGKKSGSYLENQTSRTVGQLDGFEKREVEDDQPRANQAGQLGQQLPLEFRTAF